VGVQVASLLHGVLVLGSYQVSVSKIQLGSKTESFPSCRCFGEDKISIDWTLKTQKMAPEVTALTLAPQSAWEEGFRLGLDPTLLSQGIECPIVRVPGLFGSWVPRSSA
jgi:hypothetical protein